jgi:hypothetical protein
VTVQEYIGGSAGQVARGAFVEFEAELEALRREISANWVSELDAAAIVADQRR